MEPTQTRSDIRHRLIAARPAEVFAAMSDPDRIARWWGPTGFTNTIAQFEFKPGGMWRLTMHGPDGTDYPNVSRFTRIVSDQAFEIEHLNGHHFLLSIELVPANGGTKVQWQQIFDTAEHYERIAEFVASANEQNLDRLAAEVQRGRSADLAPVVRMIGNWEMGHISEPKRFVLYARGYLDAASVLCDHMVADEAQRTWPNAAVILMLSAHSVELFLKGAILRRDNNAKVHGHRIDLLTVQYEQLYAEPEFEFEVPFLTDYPSISEEEIEALIKNDPVLSILFRYPVSKPGVEWQGIHAFEANGFLRLLCDLRKAYERIGKAI